MRVPLQQRLSRVGVLSLWAMRRQTFSRALREYERIQYWPADRIRELQWQRLKAMLAFAFANCPFYTSRLRAIGAEPDDIVEPKHLLAIPVLTKEDIRHHQEELTAAGIRREEYEDDFTGGSTGTPLAFKVSKERRETRNAMALRHDRWCGWDLGEPLGILWGHPADRPANAPAESWKERLHQVAFPQVWLDTFDLREESIPAFVDELRKRNIRYLQAYSRSLLTFAQVIAKLGLRVPRLTGIITTAELITPEERGYIEAVLQCPTFDRYGCRETSVVASECAAHDGLHIAAEGLWVEIVATDRHAEPGKAGQVVVTDLLNRAMPLIRYRIGDVASSLAGTCSCGRGLPRIAMLAGRITDFIHTPDDRWLSGVAINTYLLSQIPDIEQVQVQQEACDLLRFRMVPQSSGRARAESFLLREVPKMFGPRMRHMVEWVTAIAPTASGKTRVTISSCADKHGMGPAEAATR